MLTDTLSLIFHNVSNTVGQLKMYMPLCLIRLYADDHFNGYQVIF